MAYIQTDTWTEEAWGRPVTMYDSELHASDEEVADILVEQIIANGLSYTMENLEYKTITTLDDYTDEDIEIDTADFIDIKALEDWYESMTEEEAEAWEEKPDVTKEIDLYAAIGVLSPEARR